MDSFCHGKVRSLDRLQLMIRGSRQVAATFPLGQWMWDRDSGREIG